MLEFLVPAVLIVLAAVVWLAILTLSGRTGAQLSDWRGGLAERAQANRRAEAMLCELLSEQEQHQLAAQGYLEILGRSYPSRAYRIPRRRGQITVVEDGIAVASLCIQPTVSVPDADLVLIHKVLIEADEATYLATANRFPVHPRGPVLA